MPDQDQLKLVNYFPNTGRVVARVGMQRRAGMRLLRRAPGMDLAVARSTGCDPETIFLRWRTASLSREDPVLMSLLQKNRFISSFTPDTVFPIVTDGSSIQPSIRLGCWVSPY